MSGQFALPPITSVLTIVGAGSKSTIIQAGDPIGPTAIRIEQTGSLSLETLTVRNGAGNAAGGIDNRGAAILKDILVTDNLAAGGGGVYNGGTMLIVDSAIRQNRGWFAAGGVENHGKLTILRSTIVQNNSNTETGGIENDGDLTIIHSVIADNSGRGVAGIFHHAPIGTVPGAEALRISRSTISGNTATTLGGVAVMLLFGDAVIENTTIAANGSVDPGFTDPFGISISGATVTILNGTIADNVSGQGEFVPAPFLSVAGAVLELQNTIIDRNQILGSFCSVFAGAIMSLGNNIIGDEIDCPISLSPTDSTGDAGLGALLDGVIPLLSTSPAIDAGNNSVCAPFDQRDLPRVDGNGDGVVVCDIGAAEFIDHVVVLDVTRKGAFNRNSKQNITVDVLGTPTLDVQTIDLATVRLGATGYEAVPTTSHFKDIDRDGDVDLRLGVRAGDLEVGCDSPIIAVTAKTISGATVAGAAGIAAARCRP